MTTYALLAIVCSLIVYSYLADFVAARTKIPSVLLLLLSGIGLHFLVDYWQIKTIDFNLILPTLGTTALIMIVFDGALELDYQPHKKQLIARAFWSALVVLLLSVLLMGGLFFYATERPLVHCFLNAVPFAVISSAIAIPSASTLPTAQKEFVIYESSFSDVLGIVLFNFLAFDNPASLGAVAYLTLGVVGVSSISLVSCLLLLYLLGRITKQVKFVLIIAVLILVYALSRMLHLPALLIVFAFGLFLRNINWLKNPDFQRVFGYSRYQEDMDKLHQLAAESAFLLRTFFFIIFGFIIETSQLALPEVLEYGCWVFGILFGVRYLVLRYLFGRTPTPEFYITPRGLISILLFYTIPSTQQIAPYMGAVLLFTVLTTNLMMSYGLVRSK
jgi:NhaP-type Na+/H+ and K+/H+ antiporter